jgi:hypothetical protein
VLAAESFAAWHDADLTAHSTNAPCKICLSISGFTNANVGETIVVALPLHLFVRGTNLLDEDARRSTSLVKDVAPLPGRSLAIGIRASF